MRGYPKYIACKQDYINLLTISDDYATATKTAEPVKGEKGVINLEAVTFESLKLTKAMNTKEVNDILDVCQAMSTDEVKTKVLAEVTVIRDADDEKAKRTISIDETTGEAVTEEIENPMPLWKVKGFSSRQEVADLITAYGGK